MNEVVKYHNNFNSVALRTFDSVELNLLMVMLNKLRDKEDARINITFEEFKNLTNFTKNGRELNIYLEGILSKFNKLDFKIITDDGYILFSPFSYFKVSLTNQNLEVAWNKDFKFVLNQLNERFTRFELEEFVNFKSSYTKEFYRRMKQFRNTGFWDVNIEEFRRVLDIPKSYKIDTIDKRVLKPIKEELKDYNLKIEKKYKSNGARPKVIGFRFEFEKEKKNNIYNYNTALDLNIEQYEGITFQYINSKYPEESGMATIKYIKYDNNKYIFNYDVNNCYGTLKLSKSEFERLLNSREYHAN